MNSEVDNHILVVDSPVTNILPSLLSASSCGSWSLSLWPGLCPQPCLVGLCLSGQVCVPRPAWLVSVSLARSVSPAPLGWPVGLCPSVPVSQSWILCNYSWAMFSLYSLSVFMPLVLFSESFETYHIMTFHP